MRLENIFTYFKNQLKARQDVVKDVIYNGVKDWDEYRYLTGKLRGLEETEQELTDLLKKTELEDDD
tara:strand:- start:136 stop:333 length:198 start_codon:yes stop_codon:yes gene_type:complete